MISWSESRLCLGHAAQLYAILNTALHTILWFQPCWQPVPNLMVGEGLQGWGGGYRTRKSKNVALLTNMQPSQGFGIIFPMVLLLPPVLTCIASTFQAHHVLASGDVMLEAVEKGKRLLSECFSISIDFYQCNGLNLLWAQGMNTFMSRYVSYFQNPENYVITRAVPKL